MRGAFPMIPTYSIGNFDELGSLINYYLSPTVEDERRQIAGRARAHVLETATYELRMERVLTTVLGQ